jgi:tRNA-dihydrouridine synthase B
MSIDDLWYTQSMNYWNEYVQIADKKYPRFFSAPLDGYTDSPFRQLVREFSPENLLYSEMRHVAALVNDPQRRSFRFEDVERPLQFQMTTNGLDFVEEAVDLILAHNVSGIDLNIACPAKNVVKSLSGSAVMANPELLKEILTLLRTKLSIPLTVKMRAGFKEKNALDIVRLVEDCGVDAVAVHPRLQTERFSGEPDYSLVAEMKKVVSIPLLYSGEIHSFTDAQAVYERTGVDGFLIGRGMWGKPWKLAELDVHSRGKVFEISSQQIYETAVKHFDFLLQFYEKEGLYIFRKHLSFYVADFEGASSLRQTLITSESIDEVKVGLKRIIRS